MDLFFCLFVNSDFFCSSFFSLLTNGNVKNEQTHQKLQCCHRHLKDRCGRLCFLICRVQKMFINLITAKQFWGKKYKRRSKFSICLLDLYLKLFPTLLWLSASDLHFQPTLLSHVHCRCSTGKSKAACSKPHSACSPASPSQCPSLSERHHLPPPCRALSQRHAGLARLPSAWSHPRCFLPPSPLPLSKQSLPLLPPQLLQGVSLARLLQSISTNDASKIEI